MFMNTGAVDWAIKMAGEPVDIYTADHSVQTGTGVPAEIQQVDSSNLKATRAGLRPLLDLLANVPSNTTVDRGYAVKHGSNWYEVVRLEDHKDAQGVLVSRRLMLALLSPGVRDMRA